jgi:hypothetical protein
MMHDGVVSMRGAYIAGPLGYTDSNFSIAFSLAMPFDARRAVQSKFYNNNNITSCHSLHRRLSLSTKYLPLAPPTLILLQMCMKRLPRALLFA